MNATLCANDKQKKWTITDDTIYYRDKEIAVSSITKMRYEPISPAFKTGKITIYCGNEFTDPIYTLSYDKTENDLGEQVVEFILLKAFKVKQSEIKEEKEKIQIKKNHLSIGCIVVILLAVLIGLIIYGIAIFEPARSSNQSENSDKNGFIGSDGEYHPYVPEFGEGVNDWMEENW